MQPIAVSIALKKLFFIVKITFMFGQVIFNNL